MVFELSNDRIPRFTSGQLQTATDSFAIRRIRAAFTGGDESFSALLDCNYLVKLPNHIRHWSGDNWSSACHVFQRLRRIDEAGCFIHRKRHETNGKALGVGG